MAYLAEFTLSELYETYETSLRRFAQNLCQDSDLSDDLVSETMLKAMPHLSTLAQMNPYQRKAWLYRVLKNQFLDQLRKRKREQHLLAELTRVEIETTPIDIFQALPPFMPSHHRKILHLHFELGMTSDEIGRALDIPPATARSRLRLAIQWIKNHQNIGD